MTTPKAITFIVVGTLAFLSCVFVFTLAYCTINKIEIQGDIFKIAGTSCLSALTALLINTRSQTDAGPNPNPNSNLHSTGHASTKPASHPSTVTDTVSVSQSHAVTEPSAPASSTKPT